MLSVASATGAASSVLSVVSATGAASSVLSVASATGAASSVLSVVSATGAASSTGRLDGVSTASLFVPSDSLLSRSRRKRSALGPAL